MTSKTSSWGTCRERSPRSQHPTVPLGTGIRQFRSGDPMDEKDFWGTLVVLDVWDVTESTTLVSENHGPRGTLKSTKEVMGSEALYQGVFFKTVSEDFEGSVKSALKTCGRQRLDDLSMSGIGNGEKGMISVHTNMTHRRRTYIYIHTYTYTYTHIYIYTYIYICTYICTVL